MEPTIQINAIDTVLLDMDGTLLDLYFDNYFWQEYLPIHWAKLRGMEPATARAQLIAWYKEESGKLPWYCLDFWADRLEFDVFALKSDIEHLINVRPHTEDFLRLLAAKDCDVLMVTNAHQKLIKMKMDITGIDRFFDEIVSSHAIGHAKEEPDFWEKLQQQYPFEPEKTLLIDDNLTVLRAAKQFGVRHLLTISEPDSRCPKQDAQEFQAIESFQQLDINSH